MRLQPRSRFATYELDKKLGAGGMGEVWVAYPLQPGFPWPRVVLKVMHEHLSLDGRQEGMFLEEARLAQLLDHPNVVKVFESGDFEGRKYLTMELIDGVDLRTAIAAHGGPLWPAMAAGLIADACAGLDYAHRKTDSRGKPQKIVHRDISPDNLIVDSKGRVKLLDFGIARAESTELTTLVGMRKGKIRYMSPEYALTHEADARSDVYSMGATLYELVTGMPPRGHVRGTHRVYESLASEELPRASVVRPSLPEPLVQLIADATRLDPKKRIGSAQKLEARLREFLKDWPAPSAQELGDEVRMWRAKAAAGVSNRQAGSYGQLETTEVIRDVRELWKGPVPGSDGDEEITGEHPAPGQSGIITEPGFTFGAVPADPSVILDPELEAVAQRTPPKKKKTPKGGRRHRR